MAFESREGKACSSSKINDQIPDPSGTAGPQLQPRTLTNSIGDPDLRSYVRNDDNVPPPKIAPPVFLSAAPQVGLGSGNDNRPVSCIFVKTVEFFYSLIILILTFCSA